MSIQDNVVGPVSAQHLQNPYGTLRNFEIIKKLGHGHFSVVFSARNRCNGANVALKKVEVKFLIKSFHRYIFSLIFLVKSNG